VGAARAWRSGGLHINGKALDGMKTATQLRSATEALKAMVLRGALAANGVGSINWPDGSVDDFGGPWEALPARTKLHWESLVRVVEPAIAGL
jgi:hypothetical protein